MTETGNLCLWNIGVRGFEYVKERVCMLTDAVKRRGDRPAKRLPRQDILRDNLFLAQIGQ